jgi:tetratricopeptide (TPR) repeat protein
MKTHGAIFLVFVLAATLSAQTAPPALMVKENGVSTPLGLAAVRTEVRIFGSAAETTTTMTFANSTARVLEGDLYFPLPEGATISGYALDINGVMIDGVAVEKNEARQVYEAVVRQGIDPGLVQWTAGNNFQTRVFPIPPNGTRTIRVQYVTELTGGREAPAYHLPLKFKNKIGEFSLRVEVVKAASPPQVTKGELTNFAFQQWRDSYVAETRQENWTPVEDLVIALPKTEGPQVLVEKADDGQTYFAIQDYPAQPTLEQTAPMPKRVVVFWDASGSRAGDHKREIAVLRGYLGSLFPKAIRGEVWPIAIDLVLLRNALGKPVRVAFPMGDPSALTAALESVQYDGGTQLGAIGPIPGAEKPDMYLLFTDGISNFGSEEPARLDAPLYIFSADAGANHALLHGLAMSNGGRYYNLANWKDADIFAQAGKPAWSFLAAKIDGGEAADLYPQRPQPLGGRFTLVGKLSGETATVTADYGIAGGKSDKQTFKVSRSEAASGSLLQRLWAGKKLAELMIHQKPNQHEIAALGKKFNLVTPYTSLLVLDSLEQYVRYDIAPPKSLPAMREEYMRRIDTIEHQKQREKADKTEEVVRMWQERVNWWTNEFKYPKDFKYAGGGVQTGGQTRTINVGGATAERGAAPSVVDRRHARAQDSVHGSRESAAPAAPSAVPPAAAAAPGPAPVPALHAPEITDNGVTPNTDVARSFQTMGRAYNHPQSSPVFSGTNTYSAADKKLEATKTGEDGRFYYCSPAIAIQPWNPDTPYLKELQAAKGKAEQVAVYMKNRAAYGNSPGFFLDCADFFTEQKDPEMSLQVLSNIAELELEDAALLRVLGHRLEQIGELDLAVQTFERVLELRPEEPQSYRDLALTLAHRAEQTAKQNWTGKPAHAIRADYARAVDLLARVVLGRWDARFPEIEVIALEELNDLAPRAKAAGAPEPSLDPRLLKLLDVDVRIVMTWHADNTDIDLWVTEPSGEKAFYQHNRTMIGGLVSCDFTQGYGPEEYMVRRAAPGTYTIEANYFGSRAVTLLGPVTVQVDVLTNFGRPNQQRKSLTIRLKEAKETVRIGQIEF